MLETALNEEMTEHLGFEKHDPAGAGTGNIRNGTRAKTVLTDNTGPVEIDVPQDRAATFEPQIVKKRQRRLSGIDEVVLSLYAKGLTTGEISAHFAEIYDASVSKETISRITDKVIEEMNDWAVRHSMRSTRRSSSTRSWSKSVTGRSVATTSGPDSADMRLTEQASLTLFEVPDIDTHRAYSPTRLPSAIAKNGSGRRIYIPATVLREVWDYIRFDRAVLIEQARRRGIYDRIPAKLLVEDPQYAAVAPRSAGGRRRPVETLDPRQRRRLFICGTEGLEPLCSAWSPLP